jgi:hypothetical protein
MRMFLWRRSDFPVRSSICVYASLHASGAGPGMRSSKGGRTMSRFKCAVASIAACATIVAVGASAATAKPVTLHFFSKQVYSRLSNASGQPSNSAPAVGDRLSLANNDFVGNHKQHAKRPTASDYVVCTVTSTGAGLCDSVIAIGGSMIVADDSVLDFGSNITTFKITGGTGRYRHAHGSIIGKDVGSNTDLTIKVSS